MDGLATAPYRDIDYATTKGAFFTFDAEEPFPYDLRKCEALAKKLGVKPGEAIPDKFLAECIA